MKKITFFLLVFLLLIGCQSEEKSSIISNETNGTSNESSVSLEAILKDKTILDMKIYKNNFLFIVSDKENTSIIVYSIDHENIIIEKDFYDGRLSMASIIVLNEGYVISYNNGLSAYIYNSNNEQVSSIDISSYGDNITSMAVSQNLKYIAYVGNLQTLYLLNIENNEVTEVLSLNNETNELNIIDQLAFLDDSTLIYCGGTYLNPGEQSTGCYGTINLETKKYDKVNSSAVVLSSYQDKILVHNQDEGYGASSKSTCYYYDGINGKSLNISLIESINARLTSSGIIFVESGSAGEIKPEVRIDDNMYTMFSEDYIYIVKCEYYNKKIYLYGYTDDTTKVFSITEIE